MVIGIAVAIVVVVVVVVGKVVGVGSVFQFHELDSVSVI